MQGPASFVFTALIAGIAGVAIWPPDPDPAVIAVASAAKDFVATLPPALRAKACRPFADAERTTWNFLPGIYPGVMFGDLDADATKAAHALLHAVLSARGFDKAMAIVALESVLKELEGKDGHDVSHRDPARYTLLVCGEPVATGSFAVRLQGHHLSLHFTFHDGRLAGCTPQFLGSNPHELRSGKNVGQRVFAAEEDLARGLLALASEAQRKVMVLDGKVPADIFLGPAVKPEALGARQGLAAKAMTAGQKELLVKLIEEYAHNLRPEFADAELAHIQEHFDGVHFVWIGGTGRGQGHYWRVHGEHFAIEYDNTQNDANHVHTVWRDFERDFGEDALKAHYQEHRHDGGK